ncbi:MAG TPA: hypothetical protein VF771_21135 [Longimicrobiaceae bacterium]
MSEAVLHPLPRRGDVVREQFLSVGLSLRREALTVGGLAGLVTAAVAWYKVTGAYSVGVPLAPEAGIPVAMLSLLVPMAVWKGEGPAQRGYHRAMPVQHGAHAVARSLSGLVWLLAGVSAYFGWLGLLAAFTGGAVESVPVWRWLTPFAGATVLYLLGSALTLRVAHAWRWLGGAFVGYMFLGAMQVAAGTRTLFWLANQVVFGRLGISTVVTGLVRSYRWENGPYYASAGVWLAATWLWLAIAITLFVFAAYRQPES